jgi:hypothetical protein
MKAKLVVASMVLVTAGCAVNVPDAVVECSVPRSRPAPKGPALVGHEYGMKMSPIPLDAVQFTEQRIANTVAVQALYASRTPTETVQVTARFVNCTEQPIAVRARTSFLRASQAPSEPISAWQTVYLSPKATGIYTESSIGRGEVMNYLVELASDQ